MEHRESQVRGMMDRKRWERRGHMRVTTSLLTSSSFILLTQSPWLLCSITLYTVRTLTRSTYFCTHVFFYWCEFLFLIQFHKFRSFVMWFLYVIFLTSFLTLELLFKVVFLQYASRNNCAHVRFWTSEKLHIYLFIG